MIAVHKEEMTINELVLFVGGHFLLMCSDQGRRSTFPHGNKNITKEEYPMFRDKIKDS